MDAPTGPDTGPERPERPVGGARWRLGTAAVLGVCGVLVVTSALSSGGTDLRPGRYNDLSSLVELESRNVRAQQAQVAELGDEVAALADRVGDDRVAEIRTQADAVSDEAGLAPVTGAGVTVTLSDAPDDVEVAPGLEVDRYVVHQQDIQAVVNAMWRGGARAVLLQGQRIISTTGIKCQGNSVTLQGVPYPEPYVISAVGDLTALTSALDQDPILGLYRLDAADPSVQLGWDLTPQSEIEAPAYDGLLDLNYAQVAER